MSHAANLAAPRPATGIAAPVRDLRTVVRSAALLILLLAVGATLPIGPILPRYFLWREDMPVIAVMLTLAAVLLAVPGRPGRQGAILASASKKPAAPWVVAGLMVLGALAGHRWVMHGYALSRDEQMALFDAQVFSHGEIIARLPAEWARLQPALNTLFMPSGLAGKGWISVYGPVNAALHALVGRIAGTEWTNPLLAAAGLIATWRVACRLLPGDRESQFVAVVLYATSTQVLAAAMTSYAMTGHLALNMIWLALFLHDRWYSHIAALGVGVLAIGLHQVAYHPMFGGPILFFGLVLQRRWGWSVSYAAAYAAAIWFWARYAAIPLAELHLKAGPAEGDGAFLTRLMWALQEISPEYLWTQAANLVRFLAWQNLLLLPLFLAGAREAFRARDWRLAALVAAVVVLIVFKLVLRPYQGHGWGYRYMHGVIGIACVLAAVGWQRLRASGAIDWRHLKIATAATVLVAMPWLLWQAHAFSGLFARPDRAIAASGADVLIVEETAAEFTQDLVYNPPYLDRRPIRLLGSKVSDADMAALCARHDVAILPGQELAEIEQAFGRPLKTSIDAHRLLQAASRAGCRVRQLEV